MQLNMACVSSNSKWAWTRLTCFGQVEVLLAQVRDQAEQRDPPAKDGQHDVEVVHLEGRHIEFCARLEPRIVAEQRQMNEPGVELI